MFAKIKKNKTILLNNNGQTNYPDAIDITKIEEIVKELKGDKAE